MCPTSIINISRSRKRIDILSQIFLTNYGMISILLPTEKQINTIGHPIVPYRKVLDMVSCIFLELDVNSGKCYLKNMVLVLHVIDDFLKNRFDYA